MYLSHHYLVDLTGGACLSVITFYLFMPAEFKDSDLILWPSANNLQASEYEMVADVDFDEEIRRLEEDDEERGEVGRKARTVSWGETRVLGEEGR